MLNLILVRPVSSQACMVLLCSAQTGRVPLVGKPLFVRTYLTIAQAFAKIDWQKHALYPYVVIDPLNPNSLEYLDEAGYRALQRVCLSKDKSLMVVATPESTPNSPTGETGTSPTSPLKGVWQSRFTLGQYFRSLFPCKRKVKPNVKEKDRPMYELEGGSVCPTKRNLRSLITKWASQLTFWSGINRRPGRLVSYDKLATSLIRILEKEGVDILIQKLKIGAFCTLSYLSGTKVTDTRPLGTAVKLSNGLPVYLPVSLRNPIRQKSTRTVRVIVSVLQSYKALRSIHYSLPLDTVLAPAYQVDAKTVTPFLKEFWDLFAWSAKLKCFSLWYTSKTYYSVAAGPNHPIALMGAGLDAYEWVESKGCNSGPLMDFLGLTGQYDIKMLICQMASEIRKAAAITGRPPVSHKGAPLTLGRIAALQEAAGKTRLIAIVDYWSQYAMKPLHDWLFSHLTKLPTDGTFDQERALLSLVDTGGKNYYSFDLKSATDMIPLSLYEEVFAPVLGLKVTRAWLRLLTERDFVLPEGSFGPNGESTVRWRRGQPMGALSSWAALATVHHFVVLQAASQAGKSMPFTGYRVLGDDIVIADTDVAQRYLDLCRAYGIPVGLPKSFQSKEGFLNFASQSYLGKDNISPISLKEEIAVQGSPSRLEMARRILRRGWVEPKGKISGPLRLLFTPERWMKEMRTCSTTGVLTPWVGRALRLLLTPSLLLREELGYKSTALQAWTLALQPRGGLLAGFTPLWTGGFKHLPDPAMARIMYEMANVTFLSLVQKNQANLASMKVFMQWAEQAYNPLTGSSMSALFTSLMTWRDSAAYESTGNLLLQAQNCLNVVRASRNMVDREVALLKLIQLDHKAVTLPDFRDAKVLNRASKVRYVDRDVFEDATLVELSYFIQRMLNERTVDRSGAE